MQVAAQAAQLLQGARWRGKAQHNALHVHYRLSKTGLHQHVAPVVHIGVGMAARPQAQRVIHLLQLAHGVGPQAREHQKPVYGQHALPLLYQRQRVGLGVQQHIGPYQLHCAIRRGTRLHLRATPMARLPPRLRYMFNSCLRNILLGLHHKTGCIRVACGNFLVGLQTALHWCPMRPGCGRFFDPLQALLHARAHLFVQPGRLQRRPALTALRPQRGGARVNGGGAVFGHGGWEAAMEAQAKILSLKK